MRRLYKVVKHALGSFGIEDGYEEVMTIADIEVVTLCPHHLLPCDYKVNITYSPNGYVLGLSKFARLAVILGKRPIMQETYTRELADTIFDRVHPIGVKVSVTGIHGCLKFRGAKQNAPVTTEQFRGTIRLLSYQWKYPMDY